MPKIERENDEGLLRGCKTVSNNNNNNVTYFITLQSWIRKQALKSAERLTHFNSYIKNVSSIVLLYIYYRRAVAVSQLIDRINLQ